MYLLQLLRNKLGLGMETHKYTTDKGDYFYREFHIKKRNGKTRRICAPSPDLLKVQRKALEYLENKFSLLESTHLGTQIFHGFVKNRNIVTCALQHLNKSHTITMDISNCFDSISRQMLRQVTNSTYSDLFFHKNFTLAQGFATSPILANIYLIYPIKEVIETVRLIDPTAIITVYADDIQISVSEMSYEYQNYIKSLVIKIFKKFNLTVNPSKTRTHHAKYGNRRILGIMVGTDRISPSRKLKGKIRAARFITKTTTDISQLKHSASSLGGLTTASKMLLPKALRN